MIGTLYVGAIQPLFVHLLCAMLWVLLAGISWDVFLPYFAGAVILIIGVCTSLKKEVSSGRGADKIISFGPVFLAVPMAVFGAEHFLFAGSMVSMVPSWIPGHEFWILFVGTCLIGGALGLVTRKYAALAAGLFGIMLLLFEVLLHVPRIAAAAGDRIAWAIAVRDLVFGWSALCFAVAQSGERRMHGVITLGRFIIGLSIVFFAVEHFLHPEFRPGVPLKQLTPLWIPAHLFWSYLTGAVFLVTGLALIFNKEARLAAVWLGLMVLLLVFAIYVPIVIARPAAIGDSLNSLVDTLLLSGSALCFAGAQSKRLVTQPT